MRNKSTGSHIECNNNNKYPWYHLTPHGLQRGLFALILTHTCWKGTEREELLILGIAISLQALLILYAPVFVPQMALTCKGCCIQNTRASSPLSPKEHFSDWELTPAYISLRCVIHWHSKDISPHSKGIIILVLSPNFLPDFANKVGELPLPLCPHWKLC